MNFNPAVIMLKDGTQVTFRSPEAVDAEKLLAYIKAVSGETPFLAKYPEEWETVSLEKEAAIIEGWAISKQVLNIACFMPNGKIAGMCGIRCDTRLKYEHAASVHIAILQEYWGLGIGTQMMHTLIQLAKLFGVELLELDYIEGNERARCLYEKMGFRIKAALPNKIRFKDGSYRSLIYMQRDMKEEYDA